MSGNYLKTLTEIIRKPRHQVEDLSNVELVIDRLNGLPNPTGPIDILDFSRGGCAVACSQRLTKGESVVLSLKCHESGFAFSAPSQVRWIENQEERFAAGLQFDDEIAMEDLGELFLLGVLKNC